MLKQKMHHGQIQGTTNTFIQYKVSTSTLLPCIVPGIRSTQLECSYIFYQRPSNLPIYIPYTTRRDL